MDIAVWIVIAVVIVLVLLALLVLLLRQRKAHQRVKAQHIRENASEHASAVHHREAVAEESRARADQARAEADAKAAEAKQLNEHARAHQQHAGDLRAEVEGEFARADKLDPDVDRKGNRRRTQQDQASEAGRARHSTEVDPGHDPRRVHDPREMQDPPPSTGPPRRPASAEQLIEIITRSALRPTAVTTSPPGSGI